MTVQNPQFYYANYFIDLAHMATSSNNTDALKTRLLDKRPKMQFTTNGETGSSATFTWTPSSAQTIGRLIIQNSNWSSFTATYNGGTNFSTPISVSGSSPGHFYFEFDEVSVTSITITVSATSPAGEEKKVGQIIYTKNLYSFPDAASAIVINPEPQQRVNKLSSGRSVKYVIDSDIYNFEASMRFVSPSQLTSLTTLLDENDINHVFFITRPDTSAGSWDGVGDHVFIENGRDIRNFSGNFFNAGHDVSFIMKPSGGIT